MKKVKSGITKVLDQTCLWRTGTKPAKNTRKNWPRLRVINGEFVLLTEQTPATS